MNGLSQSAANKFPHEEIWGLYIKSPTLEGNSLSQTKSANNEYIYMITKIYRSFSNCNQPMVAC